MNEALLPDQLHQALTRYVELGGPTDYVALEADDLDVAPAALHRATATFAMAVLHARPLLARTAFERPFEFAPELARGYPVTLDHFLGNQQEHQHLVQFAAQTLWGHAGRSSIDPRGELDALYIDLTRYFFGHFRDDLEVFAWSTGWSTYFSPWRTVWRTQMFTVHNRTRNLLVATCTAARE